MLLKYFYDDKLAHASYMVGCQATGEALIVDPARDIRPYLTAAAEEEMRIVGTAETHIHADYVSGSRELAARVGATLYVSDEGDADWKYQFVEGYSHQLLKDGDAFMIGNIRFEVLHTPGHTPESISFMLTDMGGGANQPMGLFSGDFVFVGSIGRPDLLEKAAGIANTSVAGARDMYRSVQRFKTLPDYLQVWPAHGAGSACGKGLGAIPSTTVGYEKLFNTALSYEDEETFVRMLLDGQPEPPKYFAVMKRVNKEGPTVLGERTPTPRLALAELATLLADGETVVDTRSEEAFAAAHVPGTINIPVDKLAAWAGWLVDYERPVYVISGEQSIAEVARVLAEIGIDAVSGYFDATDVAAAGLNAGSYAVQAPAALRDGILSGALRLIDVRAATEFAEGHLPNAEHLMLGYLQDRAEDIADDRPVVLQCRTGSRSAIAASVLKARGVEDVINMEGGIQAWALAGLPIITPEPAGVPA